MKKLFIILTLLIYSSTKECSTQENITDYQEIYHGNLPIILESPHGGMKDISSINPAPNLGGYDKYTLELTRLIRKRMIERTGESPEVVALLANRKYIDVNRKAGSKAYTNSFTKKLYEAHYSQIDIAIKRLKQKYSKGLMVLIHSGWNYPVQIDIGVNHKEQWSTIPQFVKDYGWDTFHGMNGIGGQLYKLGYEVPGFGNTKMRSGYAGIPILTRCRKKNNIGIDGLEFEFQGKTLLANKQRREQLANDIADVILDFVNKYYTKIQFR